MDIWTQFRRRAPYLIAVVCVYLLLPLLLYALDDPADKVLIPMGMSMSLWPFAAFMIGLVYGWRQGFSLLLPIAAALCMLIFRATVGSFSLEIALFFPLLLLACNALFYVIHRLYVAKTGKVKE